MVRSTLSPVEPGPEFLVLLLDIAAPRPELPVPQPEITHTLLRGIMITQAMQN